MSREAGGTAVLLVGLLLVRLTVDDVYQRYVRVEMGPWLLVAGGLLIGLGLVTVAAALSPDRRLGGQHRTRTDTPHGSDHHHSDRIGWLLLVPVIAMLLAPPPALGSFGVDRAVPGVSIASGGRTYAPLADLGLHPLTIREFDERAYDAGGASLAGKTVELTGFVARSEDGAGYRLARFEISCCAADAVAAVVRVIDPGGASPARDSWVTVVGTFRGVGPDGVPELDAASAQPRQAPIDPYE